VSRGPEVGVVDEAPRLRSRRRYRGSRGIRQRAGHAGGQDHGGLGYVDIVRAELGGGASPPHIDELAPAGRIGVHEVGAVVPGRPARESGVDAQIGDAGHEQVAEPVDGDSGQQPHPCAGRGGGCCGIQRVAGEAQPHRSAVAERLGTG
jgi:hypothetical protein